MIDWISPQTIENLYSDFNGVIRVQRFSGKFSLWVDGAQQSGPWVEKVWTKVFQLLPTIPNGHSGKRGTSASRISRNNDTERSWTSQDDKIKVLILGLASGSMIPLIQKKWPEAKITGIEIDPLMIALGKKYFHLDKYENLEIKIIDANKYLQNTTAKFDLIIFDLYKGKELPQNTKLFSKIAKLLKPNGILMVNQLKLGAVKNDWKLKKFKLQKDVKVDFNTIKIYTQIDNKLC